MTNELVIQRATTMERDIVDAVGVDENISALNQSIVSGCAEVRAAIAQAGFKLPTDSTLSVPPSLVNDTLSIIIYHFASRALAESTLNQTPRDTMYRNAKQKLDDIRNRRVSVEDAETGLIGSSWVQVSVVPNCNPQRSQWRNM